jgi:hypothetical protein
MVELTEKDHGQNIVLALEQLDQDLQTTISDRYREITASLPNGVARRFERAIEYCDRTNKDIKSYIVATFGLHGWYKDLKKLRNEVDDEVWQT